MNQRITKLLAIAALASAGLLNAKSLNHYLGRGVSNNMAMEVINVSKAYGCSDAEDAGWFGNFTVEGFYNGSFNNKKANGVGSLMSFGGSTTNVMTVGGGTTARTAFNIDGYQLGLGDRPDGTLSMKLEPKMYSAGANLMLFVGANRAETGFWFKASGAVGVQSVDPQLTESGTIGADTIYATGTFGDAAAGAPTTATTYDTMAQAFAAKTAVSTNYKQMKYGKLDGKQTSGAKFGDINLTLGYNFVANDSTVVGVGVRGLIPTANKPTAEYALEPIFGHAGNFAVGGELFVKTTLWSSDEDANKSLNFYLNGHASHYFKAEQTRSFDTTLNQDGSRYLLVAKYNNAAIATGGGGNTSRDSGAQFQNEVANLINYSTLTANSTVSVEGAAAALLDFNCGNWNMGAGVEFWGSAKEKLTITGTLPTNLVILGRQVVEVTGGGDRGYCQPNATMNSMVAFNTTAINTEDANVKYAGLAANKIKQADLNAESAANDARHSAKVFANVGYKWMDSSYCPFLGLTGSADFATSKRNAASHWGVAVQGGLCF